MQSKIYGPLYKYFKIHLVSFLWDKTKQGTFIHEPRGDLRFLFPDH